jgi:hypothetical protein
MMPFAPVMVLMGSFHEHAASHDAVAKQVEPLRCFTDMRFDCFRRLHIFEGNL